MARSRTVVSFILLGAWILASCTTAKRIIVTSPMSVSTPTKEHFSVTSLVTLVSLSPEATETKKTYQNTPNATPTKSTIFNNPNQITDGNLKLSVKEVNNTCHRPGTRIPIMLTYENMTNTKLKIVDYNAISTRPMGGKGQLYPVLATLQNVRLFAPEDLMTVDVWNPDSPLVQELPANSKFEVSVEYYFPSEFMVDRMISNQSKPAPAGQYFLKLVYIAYEYEDAWEGKISSNQVEICISE